MTTLPEAALAYARRDWRVFPLHGIVAGVCTCGRRDCASPGKHPLTRRGLHDATVDQATIVAWWRGWRRANIGIATGPVSELVVVDLDMPAAQSSLEILKEQGRHLPATLSARTGGGGAHLFYRQPGWELSNTAGRLPGVSVELPGIDLRAEGGYVVAPPSAHISGCAYSWTELHEIAAAPDWLREPERQIRSIVPSRPVEFRDATGSAYGRHVLAEELKRVAVAAPGTRNHTLNRAAFAVAQLVAGGELAEARARAALWDQALSAGLLEQEARLTIDSAFRAGSRQPRCAPHRI